MTSGGAALRVLTAALQLPPMVAEKCNALIELEIPVLTSWFSFLTFEIVICTTVAIYSLLACVQSICCTTVVLLRCVVLLHYCTFACAVVYTVVCFAITCKCTPWQQS
jgi:hypothetical protein